MLIDYTHTPVLSATGVTALGVSMVTSILPDVDNPNTTSAKALFHLAMACEVLRVTHRGPTHSLPVAAGPLVLAGFQHGTRFSQAGEL